MPKIKGKAAATNRLDVATHNKFAAYERPPNDDKRTSNRRKLAEVTGPANSDPVIPTTIEQISTGKLKIYARQVRRYPSSHIEQLSKGIDVCGFNNPIIVDQNNYVLAGAARLAAAKKTTPP